MKTNRNLGFVFQLLENRSFSADAPASAGASAVEPILWQKPAQLKTTFGVC
jgi:hypothetical protein